LISRRAMRDGVRLNLTAKELRSLSVLTRQYGQIPSKTLIIELMSEVNFEKRHQRCRDRDQAVARQASTSDVH
jgi:DNA-binding response OmpR family regulator